MSALSSDITLFAGGLFPRIQRRFGLRPTRTRILSIFLLPAIAWIPLVVLCIIDGTLLPGRAKPAFVNDFSVHIRLLFVLPLLIVAGFIAEQRIRPTLQQFVVRHLITDETLPQFDAAIASALRWGDSVIPDVVALILIYGFIIPVEWHAFAVTRGATWYTDLAGNRTTLSTAGVWYALASLPIVQFLLLRWYYRLFIWARVLWSIARLKLRLIPSHPDRFGGLGFLPLGTRGLSTFAVAHGALLAGFIANRVFNEGMKLQDFKDETALLVVIVLIVTVSPLLVFTPALILTKRRGVIEYGALASRYVVDFDRKWVRGGAGNEALIGSADIQSLADMGGTYDLVDKMRSLPVTLDLLVAFIVATLLPVAPLLLTVMPLEQVLKKLVGIMFP